MKSTQPIPRCRYSYDPLDRLISRLQPDAPVHQRFYCKNRLTTEIQGAMRYSIVQHGDQLLAQQRSEGDAPGTTLLTTDQQRSVLHTLKSNQPPQAIVYSPYGHRPAESGLLSLLGFNGERPDPVTGHYLLGNGYRAFNPVLMRFNSPDSLSPFGKGGLNCYAYCDGDPRNYADPTGHKKLWQVVRGIFRRNRDSEILAAPANFPRPQNGSNPGNLTSAELPVSQTPPPASQRGAPPPYSPPVVDGELPPVYSEKTPRASANERFHRFGHRDPNGRIDTIDPFDPVAEQWARGRELTLLPPHRHLSSTATGIRNVDTSEQSFDARRAVFGSPARGASNN